METKKTFNNNLTTNTSASYSSSNMVLSRPNSSTGISIINLHTTSSSNDSRGNYNRQHSNHKYGHKSRNGGDDFIMLQRPTPIILAKPVTATGKLNQEQDFNRIESKDENSKPQYTHLSRNAVTTPAATNLQPNKTVKLLNDTGIKSNATAKTTINPVAATTPILANLSTNLTSHSASKIKPTVQQSAQAKDTTAQPAVNAPASTMTLMESIASRLSNNVQPMINSVKLLDENLQFQDSLSDFLADQPDFLVVGVLGKKGVGKSTIMSLLAGAKFEDTSSMFKQASAKESSDFAQHKTNGINAFITSERTILLDVQPLLSGSVLDKTFNMDKKHFSNDFKYYENYIELQSIELACFVLSVCNVVIVLEDWFFDPNLFRLLQTAEMLMPHNSLSLQEEYQLEHHPHLVYALNKIEYMNKNDTIKMKACIDSLLHGSNFIYKGSVNDLNGLQITSKQRRNQNVNFVLIPKIEPIKHTNQQVTEYDGLPSLNRCVKHLLREILSVKRSQSVINPLNNLNSANPNSNLVFSEKRWFSYANKVWETIRKSQLIGEYNRLMT